MIALKFRDTVVFWETTKNGYGVDVLADQGDRQEMKGMLVQSSGYNHANNQDAITTDAVLYLPSSNAYLKEKGYRLEGLILSVNPFGEPEAVQYYRVEKSQTGRDLLLGSKVAHIECNLKKIAGPKDVS